MLFKLAWKNLWRNKKRTIIVSASIFSAVITACIMRSAQLGSYSYMIDSSAKMLTGYLQIQGRGFWENRSMNKSIVISDRQMDSLGTIENITNVTPRLEGFALLSRDSITKVAPVIGIDPTLENNMTKLKDKLSEGHFLTDSSKGIILAQGLARRLNVTPGDSVVLLGSGYHGQNAAAILKIEGLLKLPLPQMNNSMSFLTLANAQRIYAAPQRITSLSIMIDDIRHLDRVKQQAASYLKDNQIIMTWDEMMPELVQSIEVDNASGMIMIFILYIVIAFGVFGTIMMMTTEREKEFGILYSVGMKKHVMMAVSAIESLLVSLIGVAIGVLGSIPINIYMSHNPIHLGSEWAATYETFGIEPIMPFTTDPSIYFWQSVIVFLIALTCAVYPVLFIGTLDPVKAMRK
jgi:ABC-type lipoprotein release transport system permease subunit